MAGRLAATERMHSFKEQRARLPGPKTYCHRGRRSRIFTYFALSHPRTSHPVASARARLPTSQRPSARQKRPAMPAQRIPLWAAMASGRDRAAA